MGKKAERRAVAALTAALKTEKTRRRRAEKTVPRLTRTVEVLTTRADRNRPGGSPLGGDGRPAFPAAPRLSTTPRHGGSAAAGPPTVAGRVVPTGHRCRFPWRSRMTRDELAAALA